MKMRKKTDLVNPDSIEIKKNPDKSEIGNTPRDAH